MRTVVFVLPYFGENARRYLRAFASLEGARLGIISQQPLEMLPEAERAGIDAHYRVADAMDVDQLEAACKGIAQRLGPIDRLVGMLEQTMEPIAAVRERMGIRGLWSEAARNFRDKDRMKAVLREAGLPVAKSRLIQYHKDLIGLVEEVGFPVVVKPVSGLGSRATFRIRDTETLRSALEQMNPSPSHPWQAEEFVQGEENTFEVVTIDGKTSWWSGSRYRPGPLTVLENPWIQYTVYIPRLKDAPEFAAFRDLNEQALKVLGQRDGLSHMEWFRRKDGSVVISEVGARPPGVHLMPMMGVAHDVDMLRAWAELMTFERFTPRERVRSVGVCFFRGQGVGGRVVDIHGLAEAQAEVGELVIDRQLPRLGQARSDHYEGEGWAMVAHPETAKVEHALSRLITRVQVRLG